MLVIAKSRKLSEQSTTAFLRTFLFEASLSVVPFVLT